MSQTAEVADAVVSAAATVPGVTGLNSGRFGEVATYLPGRRVVGVRLHDHSGEVHIEVDLRRNVIETAEAVRLATEAVAGRPMTVIVEDVTFAEADEQIAECRRSAVERSGAERSGVESSGVS